MFLSNSDKILKLILIAGYIQEDAIKMVSQFITKMLIPINLEILKMYNLKSELIKEIGIKSKLRLRKKSILQNYKIESLVRIRIQLQIHPRNLQKRKR